MAKKRVIAYYMHEREQYAATQLMSSPEVTDSFAIGEVEESEIAGLRAQGVIVVEPPAEPAEEPSEDAGAGPATRTRSVRGPQMAIAVPPSLEEAVPAPIDYYYVRLRGPLVESWRQQLESAGVRLIESVPGRGFKARLSAEQVATLKALDFVHGVKWITPAHSAPKVMTRSVPAQPGQPPPAGVKMLTFDVRLNEPEGSATVEQWLHAHNITISGSSARKFRIYATEDSPLLDELGALPEVDTVDEYKMPKLCNDAARRLLAVDAPLGSTPATYLTQDGKDQIVAVADTGIDDKHPDFQGRIAGIVARGRQNDWSDPEGHGTHVAGSVLGDGTASNGQIKGVAPKAKLFFQSLLDGNGDLGGLPVDLNDLFDEAYQAGARIHNNSWGAETPSIYTIDSEEVDEFVRSHPDMLILVAAGNAGSGANPQKAAPGLVDWLSIGSPASCKNALTVGASRSDRTDGPMSTVTWGAGWPNLFPKPPIADATVSGDPDCLAAFSSRGPCVDHRIKPDLVAPGTDIASTRSSLAPLGNFWGPYPGKPGRLNNLNYAYDGGTSMATPLVAGCAALVRQYYLEQQNHRPSAALLKATLANSTAWLQGIDADAPSKGKPNYHQGHGRVCMRLAIPNPSQPGMELRFVDNWQDQASQFLRTGQRKRYQFILPAGAPELRICLAYTDAPASGLQNNLNLVVQRLESGTKWMGNAELPDALTLPDADNNMEKVRIANPAAGRYLIQVFVGNMLKPPQDFALVVTAAGLPPLNEAMPGTC